jgi:hypothetical protein
MDGVIVIQSFYGKILQVTVFSKNEEELGKQIKMITSIDGDKIFTHWKVKLPKCNHKAKQTDWMIIGALLKNADKKISEIAHELKVSAKTVKRRINMMMSSSAFYLQPILDLRKLVGALPCQLLVQCSEASFLHLDKYNDWLLDSSINGKDIGS